MRNFVHWKGAVNKYQETTGIILANGHALGVTKRE